MNLSVSAILLYAIAGAVILTYFPFLVVGYTRAQLGYDTSAPRAMFDKLPDYAKRATWAHQNSFESLIVFSAAAMMAYLTNVSNSWALIAAIAFLIARLFYSIFYIANVPILRSLMFGIGTLASGTLFVLSFVQINS